MRLVIDHLLFTLLVLANGNDCAAQEQAFVNFESPQSHGLATSSEGNRLFVVNTPANSLVVLSIDEPTSPKAATEIPVGLEPVSVAQPSENEVWVVNHLSDSVSVIDLRRGVVVETVQVGDRPGDVVFADQGRLAFVSSMNEQCVYVIDVATRKIKKRISIPTHSPRTLLASSDEMTVWVASYLSGNGTTVVPHNAAPAPPTPTNAKLPDPPRQGIIVSATDPRWKSQLGFELKDEDVFEIDVETLNIRSSFAGVGTTLFNLAQHSKSGEVWVVNTDARNLVRFEPQLKGHVVDNRISRLDVVGTSDSPVSITDLNPHIDYEQLASTVGLETAIAQPTDIVFNSTGDKAFVASFGTDRIGVLDDAGNVLTRIELHDAPAGDTDPRHKRGPRSLAMHRDGTTLYVLNRLSNSVSVVDTKSQRVVNELVMSDPTPDFIRAGRGYLFDAKLSGNGTVSCASCHVDGDRDGLAWDLGDPGGAMFNNGTAQAVHPMKGPLLTQTLRGLAGEKLFHWRADRPGLASFNGTFEHLMGGEQLADNDLAVFVGYLQSIHFGPNPRRNRGDSLSAHPTGMSARDGERIFMKRLDVGREGSNKFRCADCHMRSNGAGTTGFTGLIEQPTKVAQLRGLNERISFAGDGTRIGGFGFGADGSKAALREFFADSHRFQGITEQDKAALESFLLSFPTETPPIVGFTRTVHAANLNEESIQSDVALLIEQAQLGNCSLSVTGLLRSKRIDMVYDRASGLFRDRVSGDDEVALEHIMAGIGDNQSFLSFVANPAEVDD
ncbi:MAG: beta-propeller fold lactonase family protein [Planctomycetes bacterium]|nr:beta-propeller fold lactonase family protein [Planctomycetota bacterium]MBL7044314.1 beta-propeller fold lactonase family protein [Pirellulaceae bacterium]